jgi:hypothetical protein
MIYVYLSKWVGRVQKALGGGVAALGLVLENRLYKV